MAAGKQQVPVVLHERVADVCTHKHMSVWTTHQKAFISGLTLGLRDPDSLILLEHEFSFPDSWACQSRKGAFVK